MFVSPKPASKQARNIEPPPPLGSLNFRFQGSLTIAASLSHNLSNHADFENGRSAITFAWSNHLATHIPGLENGGFINTVPVHG